MIAAARILSILIGLFFMFSGFVKGVDPIGFGYKLDEYFEVFSEQASGIPALSAAFLWMKHLSLPLAVVFIVLELVLGWMAIFLIRMPLVLTLMLLLMLFFTFLTGYAWYTGKVADCGCFGDAIKLTPAQTFYKDIVLTAVLIPLFLVRRRLQPIFRPTLSNIVLLIGLFGSIYLPVYCLRHLPIIDFRPYKVGTNLREQMSLPPNAKPTIYKTYLTYRNKQTGEVKEYPSDNFPWNDSVWVATWEFVASRSELVQQGDQPRITDFHVWDIERNEVTRQILDERTGFHFWLVTYDLTKAPKKAFSRINRLAAECEQQGIPFVALTATPYEQLEPLRHELQLAFPFYYADATVLKTIIRSNPGLVLLQGPVVRAMWHYNDIPDLEKIRKKYFAATAEASMR
ncbi:MAG: hypothetical protein NZL95_09405 [Chitinophagales bacterium]|nr:hypothetical protein [Chitinophagales bacterium]MDW8428750.1 hypothetical protein [Chitinophagales bacterium]